MTGPIKKFGVCSLDAIASGFTRARHVSVVDQYVETSRFSDHSIDNALATLFISDTQYDLSATQSASGRRPDFQSEWNHPLNPLVRKVVH